LSPAPFALLARMGLSAFGAAGNRGYWSFHTIAEIVPSS
jgi:hypothetical protein